MNFEVKKIEEKPQYFKSFLKFFKFNFFYLKIFAYSKQFFYKRTSFI